MTGEIVIKMGAPPRVFVDGIEVGVRISADFHKSGGLDVKNLTIKGIANGATIAKAQAFKADTEARSHLAVGSEDGR